MCCRTASASKPLLDSNRRGFWSSNFSLSLPFQTHLMSETLWGSRRSFGVFHSRSSRLRKFWCQGKQNSFSACRSLGCPMGRMMKRSKMWKFHAFALFHWGRMFALSIQSSKFDIFFFIFCLFLGPPGTKHHRFFSKKETVCRITNAALWTEFVSRSFGNLIYLFTERKKVTKEKR